MANGELAPPGAATTDPKAMEILRVWVAHKSQHVSLRTGIWDDPAAWGLMLTDLARHVADAYAQEKGLDAASVLARIRQGWDAELANPTDTPKGR